MRVVVARCLKFVAVVVAAVRSVLFCCLCAFNVCCRSLWFVVVGCGLLL